MKKSSKSAFTILELSAVLVIIGILIIGITNGIGLINASRITNARQITSKAPITKIDGLVAWYETSLQESFLENQTIDDSQISEWRDISPESISEKKNKATKSASSSVIYIEEGINKLPSISFSGGSTGKVSLSSFYQGNSAQTTVFIVFRPNAAVSSNAIFDGASNTNSIALSSNLVTINSGISASTNINENPASITSGRDYILAAYLNSSSSQVFINDTETRIGLDVSDNNPTGIISIGTNSLDGITIGGNSGGTSNFNGLISEAIIYNKPLKIQERKDVMRYLAKKYNIVVSGI